MFVFQSNKRKNPTYNKGSKLISDSGCTSRCRHGDSSSSTTDPRGSFHTHGHGGCLSSVHTCVTAPPVRCRVARGQPVALAPGPALCVVVVVAS